MILKLAYDITVNLIGNLLAMLIVAVIPAALAIGAIVLFQANPTCMLIALAWSASGIVAALWYQNHRKMRSVRLMKVADLMSGRDLSLVGLIIWQDNISELLLAGHPSESTLRYQISKILEAMCHTLVYRIRSGEKGASFLIVNNDNFSVYAQYNHRGNLSVDINTKLKRNGSLAGQVLRESKLRVLHNCKKPNDAISWFDLGQDTADRRRFVGRAIAPVQAIKGEQSR